MDDSRQQQEEEAEFFHALADINQIIEKLGPKDFFYFLLQEYPNLKRFVTLQG